MYFKSFLIMSVLCCTLQFAASNPTRQNSFIEKENSCRAVCGLCDCEGYYCEDECICECNLTSNENLQCISDMQRECEKNGLEYELILKESAKSRYIRQAMQDGYDFEDHDMEMAKYKRSDVIVDPVVGAAAVVDPIGHPFALLKADPLLASAAITPHLTELMASLAALRAKAAIAPLAAAPVAAASTLGAGIGGLGGIGHLGHLGHLGHIGHLGHLGSTLGGIAPVAPVAAAAAATPTIATKTFSFTPGSLALPGLSHFGHGGLPITPGHLLK